MRNFHTIKCECCGRFIAYADMMPGGGGSWVFVPDHDFGHEENRQRCRKCTDEFGIASPVQNVRVDLCSGKY